VKNYLRKVYDKLGVADRLELALYCLNSRILDSSVIKDGPPRPAAIPQPTNGSAAAIAPTIPDTTENL
jgi:hypothetical protein